MAYPVEAFQCPGCGNLIAPPVCCCPRWHLLTLHCAGCHWQGQGLVARDHSTQVVTHPDWESVLTSYRENSHAHG